MTPNAHDFMRQFVGRTAGRHADGVIADRPIDRETGLTDVEAGDVTYGMWSRAVSLPMPGAAVPLPHTM